MIAAGIIFGVTYLVLGSSAFPAFTSGAPRCPPWRCGNGRVRCRVVFRGASGNRPRYSSLPARHDDRARVSRALGVLRGRGAIRDRVGAKPAPAPRDRRRLFGASFGPFHERHDLPDVHTRRAAGGATARSVACSVPDRSRDLLERRQRLHHHRESSERPDRRALGGALPRVRSDARAFVRGGSARHLGDPGRDLQAGDHGKTLVVPPPLQATAVSTWMLVSALACGLGMVVALALGASPPAAAMTAGAGGSSRGPRARESHSRKWTGACCSCSEACSS